MVSDDLRAEIRSAVRGAIRELLPRLTATKGSDPAAKDLGDRISAAARGEGGTIPVRIASDEDLHAFAALIITCPDPVAQAALLEGKVRLVLDKESGAASGSMPVHGLAEGDGPAIDGGVLNERKVSEIAKTHKAVVVSGDVVVTPLAYDRARACGLRIMRKKG